MTPARPARLFRALAGGFGPVLCHGALPVPRPCCSGLVLHGPERAGRPRPGQSSILRSLFASHRPTLCLSQATCVYSLVRVYGFAFPMRSLALGEDRGAIYPLRYL